MTVRLEAMKNDPRYRKLLEMRGVDVNSITAGAVPAVGVDEPPPLSPVRRRLDAPGRCPACGLKVNAFTGVCGHCGSGLTSADAKPVTLSPPAPQEAPPVPKPEPEAVPPAAGPKPCPECKIPLHANGRCYKCKPGGMPARKPAPDVTPPAAVVSPRPAPVVAPRPAGSGMAAALDVIDSLSALDEATFGRVVGTVRRLKGWAAG